MFSVFSHCPNVQCLLGELMLLAALPPDTQTGFPPSLPALLCVYTVGVCLTPRLGQMESLTRGD